MRHGDIPDGSVELVHHGQNHLVIILNERIIFRFARYLEGAVILRRTATMLQTLHRRLPLPIPSPLWSWFDLESEPRFPGSAWFGYEALPGSPLWGDVLQGLAPEHQDRLVATLVEFLGVLQRIEVATEMALPQEDVRNWEALYQELNAGDFGSSNILWDPKAQRLSGLIDFDGIALGNPAIDVAALVASYGEDIVRTHLAEGKTGGHECAFTGGPLPGKKRCSVFNTAILRH